MCGERKGRLPRLVEVLLLDGQRPTHELADPLVAGGLVQLADDLDVTELAGLGHDEELEAVQAVGVVTEMSLFTTQLKTADAQHVIAPNSTLWGSRLINQSYYPVRGVEFRFRAAPDADLDRAKEVILSACRATEHVLGEPAPFIALDNVSDAGMEFLVRPFCRAAHAGEVRYAAAENIKRALDAAGLSPPPPRPLVAGPPPAA